jgi:hypothetical protein
MLLSDREAAATLIPNPITDGRDDRWLWHHCGFARFASGETNVGYTGGALTKVEIDSKSMRIWEESHQLSLVVANANASGTADSITCFGFMRVLLKLA